MALKSNHCVIRSDTSVDRVDPKDLELGIAHLAWQMINTMQTCFETGPITEAAAAGILLQFNDQQLLETGEIAYNTSHAAAFGNATEITPAINQERKLLHAATALFSPGLSDNVKSYRLRQAIGAYLPNPLSKSHSSMQ